MEFEEREQLTPDSLTEAPVLDLKAMLSALRSNTKPVETVPLLYITGLPIDGVVLRKDGMIPKRNTRVTCDVLIGYDTSTRNIVSQVFATSLSLKSRVYHRSLCSNDSLVTLLRMTEGTLIRRIVGYSIILRKKKVVDRVYSATGIKPLRPEDFTHQDVVVIRATKSSGTPDVCIVSYDDIKSNQNTSGKLSDDYIYSLFHPPVVL